MKPTIDPHPWKLTESSWNPEHQILSESLFSLGNGRMGQRANNEEGFSGKHLQGTYIAGVYYPDKTKVGWWKNGYPEYFAKVLNAVNFIGIHVRVNGEALDLATAKQVSHFHRELDMHQGLLRRTFTATLANGLSVRVEAERFLSIVDDEVAAISYKVTVEDAATVEVVPYLDFNVVNSDANWEETFWAQQAHASTPGQGHVHAKTKKLDFHVAAAMHCQVSAEGQALNAHASGREGYVESRYSATLPAGQSVHVLKYIGVVNSLNAAPDQVVARAEEQAQQAAAKGYEVLRNAHADAWIAKWELADIRIDGDDSAQQGIRFNIFHLLQTFTGVDARLNIGPKGFTGEKYGGSTYWDTEAYCLPFYMASTDQSVAKNLLIYRYKQLGKAIENAEKLGFIDGAALYPMVTMNGEECHNEWEITFEEIHRNGAIAYGIYNYIRHTQDRSYLAEGGLEVLVAIARFWAQRVNWSDAQEKFVILGVTGPNEYENNVNNNYYTNFMAAWCLEYAAECAQWLATEQPADYAELLAKLQLDSDEIEQWEAIRENLYFPYSEEHQVFLQQDGFLDKELIPVNELDPAQRPINQKWSWDRILRSCYIKQADTLQGMFFFEDRTDLDVLKRHFDFYEPLTVHESSLSPCVHTVLASRLGYKKKAYELYLRTARLDLDDYNHEVYQGLHVTAMGGTWMSVVYGFGGMKIVGEDLHFQPFLPEQWTGLSFHLRWRGALLHVQVAESGLTVAHKDGPDVTFHVGGMAHTLKCCETFHA
jgi:maltose phosphorylase